MIRERIEQAIRAAVGENVPFVVERPRALAHGDYATNAALVAKVDPGELAAKLKIEGVEKVEVAGKFINFYLSRAALVPKEEKVPQLNAGKTILVEYTSPNLFKPLHIGNLVSNILGESVARLLERTGARVMRINFPSDIGLTVAKGVWGLQKLSLDPGDIAQLGRAYVAGTEAYEGAAKKEIEAVNKALYENSDPALSSLRAQGIETSRKHLDGLCARLGSKFDKEFFESESGPIGRELVRANMGTVFEESDGAVVYRGEQDGLHTRVFLNSVGLPTYEAKDLGLLKLKLDTYPDFDITITDTGPEQTEYFKVLYAAARKVFPQLKNKTLGHIAHGYLKLSSGKMSSRLGNVITGESLLDDVTLAARGKEEVAVGALKYMVLKSGNGRDIIFDPEKSLSLEGDSGPYLQYARVRAGSLLTKIKEAGLSAGTEDMPTEASALERVLVHYTDAVARAAKELEPHYLTTFLTELAAAFNSWYASERVIGGKYPEYGAFLTAAVERTLREGLETLGIPVPEEM
ncbi:MAG: arginine--tRNA ligase [Patescibacteria group bacterium]